MSASFLRLVTMSLIVQDGLGDLMHLPCHIWVESSGDRSGRKNDSTSFKNFCGVIKGQDEGKALLPLPGFIDPTI
jgi:hypothetical protein